MDNKRPNPDELLKKIEIDHHSPNIHKKGKLKIFLGYSAGVGKTYKMLQEANRLKEKGVDIIIGIAVTHKRAETEQLLKNLDVLPLKKINYKGLTLEEFDVDRALERRPNIIIVDELAHTNVAGSRNEKRYQDVIELINNGINVFSALNIQHIENLNDVVFDTTGIRILEVIPNEVIYMADEIEVVDLPPDELIARLHEGKVYIPERARVAIDQFFKKSNLLSLRELALEIAAKHVGDDIREYVEKGIIQGPIQVGSRILVSISPSPNSSKLLRYAARLAETFNADWYAVYINSPQVIQMNETSKLQLEKNIKLAEDLGGTVCMLNGNNISEELIKFAKDKNISLIVMGASNRTKIEGFFKGAILNEIMHKSAGINLFIVGSSKLEQNVQSKITKRKRNYLNYLKSFLITAIIGGLGLLIKHHLSILDIGFLLTIPIITNGILFGESSAIFTGIVAAIMYDFLFIPPYNSFTIQNIRDVPVFLFFIIISFIIISLEKIVLWQINVSRKRERILAVNHQFSKEIIRSKTKQETIERAAKSIKEIFNCEVAIFIPGDAGELSYELTLQFNTDDTFKFNEVNFVAAKWSFKNKQPAGNKTKTLNMEQWTYYPINSKDQVLGIIAIKREKEFLYNEKELFEAIIGIFALALRAYITT